MSRLNVGSSGTAPADAGTGNASATIAAAPQRPTSFEVVMVTNPHTPGNESEVSVYRTRDSQPGAALDAAAVRERAGASCPRRWHAEPAGGAPDPAGTCVRGAVACRIHHGHAAPRADTGDLPRGSSGGRPRDGGGRHEHRSTSSGTRAAGRGRVSGTSSWRRRTGRRAARRRGATPGPRDGAGVDRRGGRRRRAPGRRRDGTGVGCPCGRCVDGRPAAPRRRRCERRERPGRDAADARQPERQRADGGPAPAGRSGSERGPPGGRDGAHDGRALGRCDRAAAADRGRSRRRRGDEQRSHRPDVGRGGAAPAGGEPARGDRGRRAGAHRRIYAAGADHRPRGKGAEPPRSGQSCLPPPRRRSGPAAARGWVHAAALRDSGGRRADSARAAVRRRRGRRRRTRRRHGPDAGLDQAPRRDSPPAGRRGSGSRFGRCRVHGAAPGERHGQSCRDRGAAGPRRGSRTSAWNARNGSRTPSRSASSRLPARAG